MSCIRRKRVFGWGLLLTGLLCAIVSCSAPYERTGPMDVVHSGKLCLPDTARCSSQTILIRDSVGANLLDYRIKNRQDSPASVQFVVESSARASPRTDAGDAPNDAGSDSGSVDSNTVTRQYELGPGESRIDRLTQDELLSSRRIRVSVECADCRIRVDYTFASSPLECRSDDDCSGERVCLHDKGRCAGCQDDSDCDSDQTCSSAQHRCLPAKRACSTGGKEGDVDLWNWMVGGLILLLVLRVRRTRFLKSFGKIGFAAGLLVCAVVFWSPRAQAKSLGASASIGVGSRFLVGPLSDKTKRGIGVRVQQQLRGPHLGAAFSFTSSYFITDQAPPPLSQQLSMFSVGAGPRGYYSLGDWEFSLGADYRRLGLVTNSLVEETGRDLNHHSFGGVTSAEYAVSGLNFGVSSGVYTMLGIPGSMVSINVSIGFGAIR